MNDEYLEKVSKQKIGYNELDKFVPGEAGLQYFPVPEEEIKQWRKDQDRKNMEAYEKREREKNNAVLEIREEEVRGNGHNHYPKDLIEDSRNMLKLELEKNKNPDHCDLKKSTRKKRVKK